MTLLLSLQREDARLTAVLLPDRSNYLPRYPRRRPEDYYSYQCYRLACERLFGQVQCYSTYSQNVPSSEFDKEDVNMVVIEVVLLITDTRFHSVCVCVCVCVCMVIISLELTTIRTVC